MQSSNLKQKDNARHTGQLGSYKLTSAGSSSLTGHQSHAVFEAVLLRIYKDYLISDQLQYGFKENSSRAHALFAVAESVINILQTEDLRFTMDF